MWSLTCERLLNDYTTLNKEYETNFKILIFCNFNKIFSQPITNFTEFDIILK